MRKIQVLLFMLAILALSIVPTLAQDEATMHIRVAHFSPDTPAVDIYVNGEVAIPALEFPTITDWIELPEGDYEIAVAPADTSIDDAAIGPATFNLVADTWVTVAAIGSLTDGTLAPAVIIEDYSEIADDSARVTVFHAIEGAPAVDVLAGDAVIVDKLAYPGTNGNNDGLFTLDVPAGDYDLSVVLDSDNETVILDAAGTTLEANSNYFIAAVGTADAPQLALAVSADMTDMMMDDEMMSNTIADIVVASASAEDMPEFTVLLAAVSAADPAILEALSNPDASLTVFAPTDAAFTALLETLDMDAETLLANTELLNSVLMYHVLDGAVMAETVVTMDGAEVPTLLGEDATIKISVTDDGVVLNDSINVITTDIVADNGVIHVIDGVLLPDMGDEMAEGDMDGEMMSNTIADIVVASASAEDMPEFKILLAAVSAADPAILEALSNPDASLTVFAPTDAAFTALLETLDMDAETLLANTELLNSVLMYHVLDGAVMAETVVTMDGAEVPTLLGEDATITISVTDDGVVLNDSINVIATDIVADNGVIHVIDGVLLPPTE